MLLMVGRLTSRPLEDNVLYQLMDTETLPDAKNGFTRRFLGFYVYISNTTSIEDGHLCFHDTNYTRSTIPAVVNLTCPVHGQYVIYFNKRPQESTNARNFSPDAHTDLCEVEVYACPEGTFGNYCKQNCSVNCGVPKTCKRTTGECEGGCQPGWEGRQCDQSKIRMHLQLFVRDSSQQLSPKFIAGCSSDTYGFDCLNNCSKSCINNTCDSVTGYCPKTYANNTLGSVIGGICGLVIAVIVVAVLILVLRRRSLQEVGSGQIGGTKHYKMGIGGAESTSTNSKPQSSTEHQRSKHRDIGNPIHTRRKTKGHDIDVDEDELLHLENPYRDFYANETTMLDIPLNQLESVIAEKRKDGDAGFQKEYAALPYGELFKCEAGKRKENLDKNRYKATFPYDHSRVILRTKSGSDYINANYIEGPVSVREYIAAQGPKQNTLDDFWTMIWQENVFSIVMLTNLREGPWIKCHQYWPDVDKNANYGNIFVQLMEQKEYAFFIVRRMTARHDESKESRTVTQYHYTAWPDHGTPDPLCLVVFLDHVTRTGTNQNNSPTIVHCSAGIGRTGTYIALDALERKGRKRKKVNVAEYVKKMRENRMNMVQTYEQYMTIFLALNEIFKSPVNINTIEDFAKKVETMKTDKPANRSFLRKEFQLLMKMRPVYTDTDFMIAKEICKVGHFTGVLPLDKCSVHLSAPVPNRGSFINAIYSFINNKAFIVTHYPQAEDTVDFLRLVSEQESNTVICLDPLSGIESSKKSHTVTVIEPRFSINFSGTPLDTSQLRSLVSVALSVDRENPVIVVSSDGATICGAFCAVHNVIQQINMDTNVDVFTSVRQLQIRRPEFCSSIEEYRLVIKAVYDHIQRGTENIYFNQ
ncbi:receptor-type tyrosine-protein phosphatase epsilon-like [Saccostrea echinata]|uniref:receptor-type tyrosine-protein phosphatase epsilon-like n=1 Tax=Saccostrea echinata TaxID=191078 RepID=UPI002A831BD3|nr:receptor-type tyrosine-protein phosphatase epsilon-like [Saccostrea echinata]